MIPIIKIFAAIALLGALVKIYLGMLKARRINLKSSGLSGLNFESSSWARARTNGLVPPLELTLISPRLN